MKPGTVIKFNGHHHPMDRSPKSGREQVLQFLADTDPEGFARLRGMIAILELPRLRGFESRPRLVEIELASGEWTIIDGFSLSLEEGMVFTRGPFGEQQWVFPIARPDPHAVFVGVPRWRSIARQTPKPLLEDHIDPTRRKP